MQDPAVHVGVLPIEEAESLRGRILGRSRLARSVMSVEIVVVASLLAYHLLLLLGTVPEWFGPDTPPGTALLQWADPDDGTKWRLTSGHYHFPWVEPTWVVWNAVRITSAVVVWSWALQVSAMNVRLHVPGPDRKQPRRLYAPELLWFGFFVTAIAAACHYATLLWRHSAPGAAFGRWSSLPSTWCTIFVVEALLSSGVVTIQAPLPSITLGLVFQLVLLGLSIAMIRAIDARVSQRLEWVRGLPGSTLAG